MTQQTYHGLTIAELRALAMDAASPHTAPFEREHRAMMLGHAMLAVLPCLTELEADNARLQTLWAAHETINAKLVDGWLFETVQVWEGGEWKVRAEALNRADGQVYGVFGATSALSLIALGALIEGES